MSEEENLEEYNFIETNIFIKPVTVNEEIAERPWEEDIGKVDISDDTFKCFTIFLIESEPSFYGIISFINAALGSRKRKAIRLISEEIIKNIALDHCYKSGERTPFAKLCEAVKRAGGENFEKKIPAELLAYMIKYRMLQEREHYLQMKVLEDKLKYRTRLRYVWLDNKYVNKDKGDDGIVDALTDIKERERLFMESRTKFVGSKKEFQLRRMKKNLKKVMRKFYKIKEKYEKKKENHWIKKKYTIQWKSYKRIWKAYKRYIKKCNRICRKLNKDIRRKSKAKKSKSKGLKDKNKSSKDDTKEKLPNIDITEEEKMDTFLNKRYELPRDLYAIDDSPLNGPQIYFILSSFKEADLPEMLIKLNIPINAYTFIGHVFAIPEAFCKEILTRDTFNDDVYIPYMKEYGDYFSLISACMIAYHSERKKLEALDVFDTITEDLNEFYNTLFKNIIDHRTYKNYEYSIIKDFVPDLTKINFNSKNWIKHLIYQLYGDISELAYHYYLITRVYEKYLKKIPSLDLTDPIPSSGCNLEIYNNLLNKLPNELISIPLILDTIITQVCYNGRSFVGYSLEKFLEIPQEEFFSFRKSNYFSGSAVVEEQDSFFEDKENTRCLLFNNEIDISCSKYNKKICEFVKDRTDYVLSLFFKHYWYSYKTKLNHLEKRNYESHYQILLNAANCLKIKDSRKFLDTLLSILSLEVNSSSAHKRSTHYSDSSVILSKSSSIKPTDTKINIGNVGSDFNSVMNALIKLEQLLKEDIQKVEVSSSSTVDESEKFNVENIPFLNEISSKLVEGKSFESLIRVRYFEELPRHVMFQVLWEAFEENNIIEKEYLPLIKKMEFICYNETEIKIKKALLPIHMSLRDFARYGQIELKEWYSLNYKEVIEDILNETFSTTEFYQLKNKIKPDGELKLDITKNQCISLNECHLMLPLKYRLILKDLQETWIPYDFKNCKPPEDKNEEESLKLPVLYNLYPLFRTTLFSKERYYVLCDSTIISFKTYGQLYREPELIINIRQNFHNFTYHTPLYVNEEPASLTCSHFKGVKITFYEIKNEQVVEENELFDTSPLKVIYDLGKDKENDLEEDEIGEDIDELPKVDDLTGNLPAKFECKLSLPNGLYLENIRLEDGTHYVKQQYLAKDIDFNKIIEEENCRLYLNDGTVVKLSKNNVIEIYYACGRWLRIPKKVVGEGEGEEDSEDYRISQIKKSTPPTSSGKDENKKGADDKKKNKNAKETEQPKLPLLIEPYHILEPDGKLYEYLNEQRFLVGEVRVSEYVSTFRDARKICIQDGPLINISGNNIQSVTFLDGTRISSELHIEEDQVFCEWTDSEKKLWFKTWEDEDEDEGEEEGEIVNLVEDMFDIDEESEKYKKIDLLEDGFLWVSVSHMIEHPDFITLVTYPFHPEKIVYMLPNEITLIRFGNGCFDLEMENDTVLLFRHNQIVLDKYEDGQLTQRACINFKVFREINETSRLLFNCRDLNGNWLRADTTGCILYTPFSRQPDDNEKQSYSEKETKLFEQLTMPYCLKTNSRRLIVDKYFCGYELLLNINMVDFQEAISCDNCGILKSFAEDPFIGHVYVIPLINYKEKWKMNYCNIDNRLFKHPSTYGKNWIFPFHLKRCVNCNNPELTIARFINEFIFEDMYKVLHDLIQEYIRRLVIKLGIVKCDEIIAKKRNGYFFGEYYDSLSSCSQNFYLSSKPRDRPTSQIGKEATRVRRKLRESFETRLIHESPLLKKSKVCKPESNLAKDFVFNYKYFRKICELLYKKEFGLYFESPKGIAFNIIDTIITRALIFSHMTNL